MCIENQLDSDDDKKVEEKKEEAKKKDKFDDEDIDPEKIAKEKASKEKAERLRIEEENRIKNASKPKKMNLDEKWNAKHGGKEEPGKLGEGVKGEKAS